MVAAGMSVKIALAWSVQVIRSLAMSQMKAAWPSAARISAACGSEARSAFEEESALWETADVKVASFWDAVG
jgi:hypothetical protein